MTKPIERAADTRPRPGPPAIAAARACCRARPDIEIDAFETEIQVRTSALAVRAWLILKFDDLPADTLEATLTTERKLATLSPRARQIFYLAAGYGLRLAEVAHLLGLSRRQVRRELLRAIACLDGRSLVTDRLRPPAGRRYERVRDVHKDVVMYVLRESEDGCGDTGPGAASPVEHR